MRIARILGLCLCCVCSLVFAKDKVEKKKAPKKNSSSKESEVQLIKPMGSGDAKLSKAELNAFKQDEKCSNFIRSCEQYAQKIKEFNKRTLDLKKGSNPSADKTIAKHAQRLAKFHNKCIKDANEVLRRIHKDIANLPKGEEGKPNAKLTILYARENFVYDTLKAVEKDDLTLGGGKKFVEPEFAKPKDKPKK